MLFKLASLKFVKHKPSWISYYNKILRKMGNVNCHRRQEAASIGIEKSLRNQEENCQSTDRDGDRCQPEPPSFTCEDIAEISEQFSLGTFVFMGKKCDPNDHCRGLIPEDADLYTNCMVLIKKERTKTVVFQPSKRRDLFLYNDNGVLTVKRVKDFRTDENCHFVQTGTISKGSSPTRIYTFQSAVNNAIYLGVSDGVTFGLTDINSTADTDFMKRLCVRKPYERFLKPNKDTVVLYNSDSEFVVEEDKVVTDPDPLHGYCYYYEGQGFVQIVIRNNVVFVDSLDNYPF
ncbi:uncharacterized protein LOC134229673 [Saccostrea cucullata]|uniref:uncharacterized protein LOC134229673 n=1 Tax=Saccostrea cuccullata TaxID=36930 RepID=UPI002ED0554C